MSFLQILAHKGRVVKTILYKNVFRCACVIVISILLWQIPNIYALFQMQHFVRFEGLPRCRGSPHQSSYLSRLHCPLTRIANITGVGLGAGEVILVTYVNKGWGTLTENWICHVRKAGLTNPILVVALGSDMCRHLPGVLCWEPLKEAMFPFRPKADVTEGTTWGTDEYQNLIRFRSFVMYALLTCGRTLLYTDVDVVFLSNPLPHLQSMSAPGPCNNGSECQYDIILQVDSSGWKYVDYLQYRGWLGNGYICAGFMLMRPTSELRRFFQGLIYYQEMDWNDQAGINICLHYSAHNLRWVTLQSDLFPNGKMIQGGGYHHDPTARGKHQPYIHHYNWVHGEGPKIRTMKENNVWCL